MKKLLTIATLTIISVTFAFAQSKDEQEFLKFIADFDQALLTKDIAYFERVLADDYIYSQGGETENKTQALEYLRKEKEKPTVKFISVKSEDMKAKVIGNTAILTGIWMHTMASPSDDKAEPQMDKGRYTVILEKRDGKWMVIAEHGSEQSHDRKLMEQQVLKMGQEFGKLYQRNDAAAEIEKILADELLSTDINGKVKNKAENLAEYKARQSKIDSVEITDQKVSIIGNGAAIETGIVRYKGTEKDGKPFDETERYTTNWVWRGFRWQMISDHVSAIRNK